LPIVRWRFDLERERDLDDLMSLRVFHALKAVAFAGPVLAQIQRREAVGPDVES
jgi:hypothetical protein